MPVVYSATNILCLVSVTFCFLTGGVLLYFSFKKVAANMFLGASYLALGFGFVIQFLIYTRLIQYLPHLYRGANFFFLLYFPLSYLYVRTAVANKQLRWLDALHLLPAFIFLVDFAPFFFSGADHKNEVIRAGIGDIKNIENTSVGWLLPGYIHAPARILLWTMYWVLQAGILSKHKEKVIRQSRSLFRWQVIYQTLQLLFFVPALLSIVTHESFGWTSCIPPISGTLLMIISLYLHPDVLYGISPSFPAGQTVKKKIIAADPVTCPVGLQLEMLMREKKPFLNNSFTLKEMADELVLPVHQVSAFINNSIGKNFNDYINIWRVNYCIELIDNGGAENLNFNGLAQKCGFNNRNTFTNAFKKTTGKTPSEYVRANKLIHSEVVF